MRRCSDDAYATLHEAHRLASTYALQSMSAERLDDLRYQLLRLTMAASGLEMFAYKLAFPNGGGGTDEGG